jgi:hypothetical protein
MLKDRRLSKLLNWRVWVSGPARVTRPRLFRKFESPESSTCGCCLLSVWLVRNLAVHWRPETAVGVFFALVETFKKVLTQCGGLSLCRSRAVLGIGYQRPVEGG